MVRCSFLYSNFSYPLNFTYFKYLYLKFSWKLRKNWKLPQMGASFPPFVEGILLFSLSAILNSSFVIWFWRHFVWKIITLINVIWQLGKKLNEKNYKCKLQKFTNFVILQKITNYISLPPLKLWNIHLLSDCDEISYDIFIWIFVEYQDNIENFQKWRHSLLKF